MLSQPLEFSALALSIPYLPLRTWDAGVCGKELKLSSLSCAATVKAQLNMMA